jgi:hypothetical protein
MENSCQKHGRQPVRRWKRTLVGAAGAPRHTPMSETFSKVEVITGIARRRRFTTDQKLLVVNETLRRCNRACRSAMLPAAMALRVASLCSKLNLGPKVAGLNMVGEYATPARKVGRIVLAVNFNFLPTAPAALAQEKLFI